MTALHHATPAAAETRTVAAVTRAVAVFGNLYRAWKNRRHVNRLADLSDHELADIGLTRSDLAVVLRSPIGVDPTSRLSAMARERFTAEDGARRIC
jgi:uncharacterized protein YjiS (DUF1127 family)